MFILNIVSLLVGLSVILVAFLGFFGVNAYDSAKRQTFLLLAVGIAISLMSYCGMRGSRSSIISLKLVIYFYACGFLILIAIAVPMVYFAYRNVWDIFLDYNWRNYSFYFPDSYQLLSKTEAVAKVFSVYFASTEISMKWCHFLPPSHSLFK